VLTLDWASVQPNKASICSPRVKLLYIMVVLFFSHEGKQQKEFIEWSEKRIDDKIGRYLQRHLQSKSANPADILCIQVVIGGDQGNGAFQFGASVLAELSDGKIVDFEVSACK
jgi:hypothetical protein